MLPCRLRSLKNQIMLLVLLPLVITIIVFTYVEVIFTTHSWEALLSEETLRLTKYTAALISNQLENLPTGGFNLVAPFLSRFLEIYVRDDSYQIYIVDFDGKVIFHHDIDSIGRDLSTDPVVKRAITGQTDVIHLKDADGENVIAGFASVPETDWKVIILRSWTKAKTPLSIAVRWSSLAGFLIAVIALLSSYLLGLRAMQPIGELLEGTGRVVNGKLDKKLAVQGPTEIQELTRSFNRMMGVLEKRVTQLRTIGEVSKQITAILGVDELLHRVVDLLVAAFNYYYANVLLTDTNRSELILKASAGQTGRMFEGYRLKIGEEGITGWVAGSGEPLLANDVEQERRYRFVKELANTKSELAVPIKLKGAVIGVLDVQSIQLNAFDEVDLFTLTTMADQLAIAIENARLFSATRQNANDLSLLLGTSTAISSSIDLDKVLETVARQITTSLVATFCRITLLDETGGYLILRAASPIRSKGGEFGFDFRFPLTMAPWHKKVVEICKPIVLRQDVPELAVSVEELKLALTEEVKSAALIPLIVGGKILGVISLGEERSWERSPFTKEKVDLCQSIAAQAAVAIENARMYEELQQSFTQTIAALAAAVDAKDPYTGGHSQRTTELAVTIALELGLSEEEIELIRYAGLLHDVGKIGVSEKILLKPGQLNATEREVIYRHPSIGANIVERVASLKKLVPIILHHHEHYNGQGYPDGLKGEDIPLKARILSVADAYEAMTSDRAYRKALTVEQALVTLKEGANKQWDGKIVEVLSRIILQKKPQA